ncbi:MAG TPA: nucleotidyltransferase domain-containing protein [Kofleriaceae bacterium]|nr:nucleotidyltransferase domain-containing protein [Kofleriaceae bacterium]
MTELPVPAHVLATADRLARIPGVVAVVLGGSRAIGTHRPDSDVDLGLYYRARLDVVALRALAAEVADQVIGVSEPGGWGPWVNGGAWLVQAGTRVDWIYRDLDRVAAIWDACRAGRYEIGVQAGHPLGFYSHVYPGEVALCRVLADPTGELAGLRTETQRYPDALAGALVAAVWEPELLFYGAASHGAGAADAFFTAGCLFRAIGVLAQALHGHHRRWVTTEKRLIDTAGVLPGAPPDFARRAHAILGRLGTTTDEIAATVTAARSLAADTIACLPAREGPALPR